MDMDTNHSTHSINSAESTPSGQNQGHTIFETPTGSNKKDTKTIKKRNKKRKKNKNKKRNKKKKREKTSAKEKNTLEKENEAKSNRYFSTERIKKDLAEILHDSTPNYSAVPMPGNIYEWSATIIGPQDTPYAGGRFFLSIDFPEEYPCKPPKIIFKNNIYHCNIDRSGAIRLDILKKSWSPALTISKVLLSICSLLIDPNPYDSLDQSIAKEYMENKEEHDATAREWTKKYAQF